MAQKTKLGALILYASIGALSLGGAGGAVFNYVSSTSGTATVTTNAVVLNSGAIVPLSGTLTEDDRIGNGTQTGWLIQNPYDDDLVVSQVILYVTTAGESTRVDVSRGTGSFATGTNAATGTTLADNLTLAESGLYSLSGSLLTPATSKAFILNEYGGTNDHILIASQSSEAGSGTVLYYNIEARLFD